MLLRVSQRLELGICNIDLRLVGLHSSQQLALCVVQCSVLTGQHLFGVCDRLCVDNTHCPLSPFFTQNLPQLQNGSGMSGK